MKDSAQKITVKAVGSLKWSALSEVVSRTAGPIIFIVLARLLTPDDFGVMATAMIAISFSQMFWDAGLSKALIQTNAAMEKLARKKGYRLVGAINYGFNKIYVKDGIGEDILPAISVESILQHPRNKERQKLFEPIKNWDYILV